MSMRKGRIKEWAESLNEEQLVKVVVDTTDRLIDGEDVRFPEDCDAPYWEASGGDLVGDEP